MAASPDFLRDDSVEHLAVSNPPKAPVLPMRRSRSIAESVAWHTHASDMPIEQVVSTWARQRDVRFVEEMLHSGPYNSMPEEEKGRLLRYASRATADDWLESLGYTANPPSIHDKVFAHRDLFR